MTREGGWERVTRGRDEGDGQEREHRGDGRRTRMSSLDAWKIKGYFVKI